MKRYVIITTLVFVSVASILAASRLLATPGGEPNDGCVVSWTDHRAARWFVDESGAIRNTGVTVASRVELSTQSGELVYTQFDNNGTVIEQRLQTANESAIYTAECAAITVEKSQADARRLISQYAPMLKSRAVQLAELAVDSPDETDRILAQSLVEIYTILDALTQATELSVQSEEK